ncbi:hypothetical protein G7Y79_00012g032230 [Physcia stellaris]|nr:hypothetical protein G7Y79_00012g032230 [Physcia stellaris]
MNNLWVEGQDTENLKPYDTSSADGGYISKDFPHYHLSDAAVVWLALSQLDKLITSIENQSTTAQAQADRVREVRQWFESHQATLSPEHIRSSIFKTFTIPKDDVIRESVSHSKAYVSSLTDGPQNTTAGIFESSLTPNEERIRFEGPLQSRSTGRNPKQIMVFERKINEYVPDIQSSDFHIIEAVNMGIFEGSHDHALDAWKETLKLQRDRDILTYEDPRQIALTLLASKLRLKYSLAGVPTLSVPGRYSRLEDVSSEKLITALYDSGFYAQTMVDDAPLDLSYWSSSTFETMSLLMGSLLEICREVLPHHHQLSETPSTPNAFFNSLMEKTTPQTRITPMKPSPLETSSRMNHKNVNDQGFLPDWMYYYPDFMHKNPLNVDVRAELETLNSVRGLESAIATWKETGSFPMGGTIALPFYPKVVDSGTKLRPNDKYSSFERRINIDDYYYRKHDFWRRLHEARSPEQAKKRLIEVSSYDKGSVLACWLSAPNSEKPLLMEFFRRHDLSESFFGERGHPLGNIWDTELHLSFYQLLDDRHPKLTSRYHAYNSEQMLSLPGAPRDCKIVHVAMSFRLTGDLRDRFWTCNFLSSVLHGFRSLVDEYGHSSGDEEKFYSDKQGQRKILEMVYVERALSEMKKSTDDILAAYKTELEELGTTVQQEENFELIHDLSSPHLKAASTLGDILQQLDSALSVLEQWEKREDTSGLRSRWSHKDQKRHGEKLQTLNMKCKTNVQFLRMQQSRLKELRRIAERQHSNLLSYKQLLEARTSTQSAADVRLFTYVTIIFLPLSFSSSLFSMAGAPTYSTVYVMVPTTAIALLTTFLLLANLKLMDRHWNSRVDRMNASTREKMKAEQSKHWDKISTELEKTNQRNFVGHDLNKRLPAESQWYYTIFWLARALKSPHSYVRAGVRARQAYNEQSMNGVLFAIKVLLALLFIPISGLIFFIHEIIITAADIIYLLSVMARKVIKRTLKSPKTPASNSKVPGEKLLQAEGRIETAKDDSEKLSGEGGKVESASSAGPSKQNGSISGSLGVAIGAILQRLESPPRPIRDYAARRYKPETNEMKRKRVLQLQQQRERTAEIEKESSAADNGGLKTKSEEVGKDVVTSDTLQERPHRLKRLFGRSKKSDVGTEDSKMWVGWSV